MPYRKLYRTPIPDSPLRQSDGSTQRQLEQLAALSGSPAVESTGSEADETTLSGAYRGQYGEMLATELRELLDADALDALPYYAVGVDARLPDEAYVTTSRASGGRVSPQTDVASQYRGTLVQKGTRGDYRRAVWTNPKQRPHPWGNDTTGYVGVPASAAKVQWLTYTRDDTQAASPDDTVTAEFGDVDRFDVESPPSGYDTRPYLVYEIAYADEGDVDTGVWDTYGRDKFDSDGDTAWGRVFKAAHEFRDDAVLDNGRLRISLDESANALSAERYTSGSWSDVTLNAADWQLFDVDLRRPGAAQVRARLTFEDTTNGNLFELEGALFRGWDDLLLYSPADLQVPSGLVTRLDPIAATTVIDPQPERTLIARSEL
jgi:hypothetical protein